MSMDDNATARGAATEATFEAPVVRTHRPHIIDERTTGNRGVSDP